MGLASHQPQRKCWIRCGFAIRETVTNSLSQGRVTYSTYPVLGKEQGSGKVRSTFIEGDRSKACAGLRPFHMAVRPLPDLLFARYSGKGRSVLSHHLHQHLGVD